MSSAITEHEVCGQTIAEQVIASGRRIEFACMKCRLYRCKVCINSERDLPIDCVGVTCPMCQTKHLMIWGEILKDVCLTTIAKE